MYSAAESARATPWRAGVSVLWSLPHRTRSPADPQLCASLPPWAATRLRPGHLPGTTESDARRRGSRAEEEAGRSQLGGDEGAGQTSSWQERTRQVPPSSSWSYSQQSRWKWIRSDAYRFKICTVLATCIASKKASELQSCAKREFKRIAKLLSRNFYTHFNHKSRIQEFSACTRSKMTLSIVVFTLYFHGATPSLFHSKQKHIFTNFFFHNRHPHPSTGLTSRTSGCFCFSLTQWFLQRDAMLERY